VQLAGLYGRDVAYFLTADTPTPRPAVLWRGRADSPTRLRIEQRFLQYCEDYARLEELAGHSAQRFPLKWPERIESFGQAERAAQATSAQMGLGPCPGSDLSNVLEDRFGVKVLITDTEGAGSAASVMDSFGAGILINRHDAPWRMNFSLAHELFHLVTWGMFKQSEIHCGDAKTAPEKFADRFAAVLLLPDTTVRREFESRVKDRALSYIDCLAMARTFSVSVDAMVWRLVSLRLVNRNSAEAALKSDKLRELSKTERREDWADGRLYQAASRRFMSLAIECLLAGRISRSRFAQLTGISRGSIDAFLKAGGYDPAGDYVGEISASTA
jgi:Zn-dependent peptidase ImmA (M78 family)